MLPAFVALLVVMMAVLAALAHPERDGPRYERYVALGDSFTAAPFVPLTSTASGCLRSNNNYPRLLAASARIRTLVDRSCTGAQIDDLDGSQVTSRGDVVVPQLRAVTPATDLVTVGIGFNHGRLYGRIASTCRKLSSVCRLADQRDLLEGLVEEVRPRLSAALLAVRERAPAARVLVIGYPRLYPAQGRCPRMPLLRPEDAETFRDLNAGLVAQQQRAAQDVGVEYVDFYTASFGHDVCSREPWVQGRLGDSERAAALHPLPEGQRALARLLAETLAEPAPAVDPAV